MSTPDIPFRVSYIVALYILIVAGWIALACLLGARIKRNRQRQQAAANHAALRAGWTPTDDEKVAAFLRDAR